MGLTRQELMNKVNAEANDVKHSGFPLEVFPQKMQTLILDLKKRENFIVEYLASAMLVAAAAAVGNTYRVKIKSAWTAAPCFYMILVGRPGMGKTPPLEFAVAPLVEENNRRREIFAKEYAEWQKKSDMRSGAKKDLPDSEPGDKPICQKMVLMDFTFEAMMGALYDNPHGILVKYDEIAGFFKTINRYNASSLIEALLSIFNHTDQAVDRCNNVSGAVIRHPCVSIIGTAQTKIIPSIATKELQDNGMIDRFLFVYPLEPKLDKWRLDEDSDEPEVDNKGIWSEIVNNLISGLGFTPEKPGVMKLAPEARKAFFGWHNKYVDTINAIDNDCEIDTRMAKHDPIVARLALVLELLHWACRESEAREVSISSMEGAIKLIEFYEESYKCMMSACNVSIQDLSDGMWQLLENLEESFTAVRAVEVGKSLGFSESSVRHWLPRLIKRGRIAKAERGLYVKVARLEAYD